MKLIIAYIQPDKLNPLKEVLYQNDIHRFSVVDAFGHSEEDGFLETYRGVEMEVDLMKKIRVEIAVNNDFCEKVVGCIIDAGKTGSIGDGKIFVIPIEETYRIRTGESGEDAIG
ncbi:MAG: P-II family nitrogen regulator [Bacteriovoracaceae bacterium]|jgi:nitrogen regulatory protein P-II 2|nr:P-II family nitrogen regulator [Bacteriovoracaceae bacterium]